MANIQFTDNAFRYHRGGDNGLIYEISDDDSSGDPKYYGYLASNGAWIIMEWNEASGTYRYAAGVSLYGANWTARASLDYGYYNLI